MNTLGKIIIIVNLIMVAIVFILERKSFKSFALWFFVIIVFPIVGFLIYIIFGNRLKFRAKRLLLKKYKSTKNYIKYCSWYEKYKKNNKNGLNNKKNSLIKYMLNNFNCNLWHNNSVKFYNNGKDFLHDLIKDLRFAKKTIFLEFYIFADDEVGIMLAEILKLKARCGVDVRLIIDAVGSRKTKKVFLRELKDAGVKVCKFFPPLFSLSFLNLKVNYRNHRKIAVIDGKVGYTGGINIRDDHMGKDKRLYPWKDSAIRLFGSATYDLTDIFLNDWNFSTGEEATNVDLTFPVAKMFCEENGGSLVCIESEEENALIAKKVKQLEKMYYIGAEDTSKEGVFQWVNGQKMEYTNWRSGEPNDTSLNGGEDYVYMYTDGTCNDAPGQGTGVGFIAEFDKTSTSEPNPTPNLNPSETPDEQPSPSPSNTPNQNSVKGDVNGDNQVTLLDAQLVLKAALRITDMNNESQGDVNGDNEVSLKDAQMILKVALKISTW